VYFITVFRSLIHRQAWMDHSRRQNWNCWCKLLCTGACVLQDVLCNFICSIL